MKKVVILVTWCIVFFLSTVRPSKLPPMPVHQPSTPQKLQMPSGHTSEPGFSAKQPEFRSQQATSEQQDEHARASQKNKDGREEVSLDSEASSSKSPGKAQQTHSSSQNKESPLPSQEESAKKPQESKSKQDSAKEKEAALTSLPKNLDEAFAALGISKNASEREIEIAYKKLALKWHPDKNLNNPEVEEKFKALGAAHDLIKNMRDGGAPAKTNFADMTKEDRRSVIISKGGISPAVLVEKMRAIHESLPREQQVKEIKESINIKSDDKTKLLQHEGIKNNEAVKTAISEEKLKENTQLIDHIQAKINQAGQSMSSEEKAELNKIMSAAFEKSYAIDAQIRRLDRPNASLADAHKQILDADNILNEAHAKFFPKITEEKPESTVEQQPRAGVKPSDRSQLSSGKNLSPEMGAIRGKKTSTESEKTGQSKPVSEDIFAMLKSSGLPEQQQSYTKQSIEKQVKKYDAKIAEIENSSLSEAEKMARKKEITKDHRELMNDIKESISAEQAKIKAVEEKNKLTENTKATALRDKESAQFKNDFDILEKDYRAAAKDNDSLMKEFIFNREKLAMDTKLINARYDISEEEKSSLIKKAQENLVQNLRNKLSGPIEKKINVEAQSDMQRAQEKPFQPTFQPQQQEKLFQPTFPPQQQMPHLQPFDYPHLRQQPVQPFQPTLHPQQPAQPFQPTLQPKKQTIQERVDQTNEKITKNIDDLKKKKLVSKSDEKTLMKKWNDLQRSYEKRSRSVANSKYDQKTKDSQQRQLDADHARILSEFQKKLQENPKSLLKKKSRLSRIKSVFKPKK